MVDCIPQRGRASIGEARRGSLALYVAISGAEHFTPARYREQLRKDRGKKIAGNTTDVDDWMGEEGMEECPAEQRPTPSALQSAGNVPFYKRKTCDPRRLAKTEFSAALATSS